MKNTTDAQRLQLLRRLENFLEIPLIILALIWLGLLIIELVFNLSPALETLGLIIWVVFIIDFCIKILLAPRKFKFLRSNLLTLISLAVPALRLFRVFRLLRLLRFTRSFRLVKVIGSLNRGIKAVSATMQRRAVGYVLVLTLIILFVGAAGMYAFEREEGLPDYASALWWTMMLLTTMGSEYWPQTLEGRILCVVLAIYAFAMFGYVTATIATFFIGRDAEDTKAELPGAAQLEELKKEILSLKELIKTQNRE